MFLCGDLGGTKTLLAIFDDDFENIREASYQSQAYNDFNTIVADFLQDFEGDIQSACFGVAGPVINNQSHITNLPWELDGVAIASTFNFEAVYLLNDLEAMATGIPYLSANNISAIREHPGNPEEPIAVIAPGTGLGEAFLTWCNDQYVAAPSEGGHCSFAPLDEEQIGLLKFILADYDHVSYERVCSGIGIRNIYFYLYENHPDEANSDVHSQIMGADDVNPVIAKAALEDVCNVCVRTIRLFFKILASEAGNLALTTHAMNGVYIGGGIVPRLRSLLDEAEFIRYFMAKGRMDNVLGSIPIYIITHPAPIISGTQAFLKQRYGVNL